MQPAPRPPGHGATELDWVLFEQEGVLSYGQAESLVGRGKVRGNLARGQWRRLCRGVLVTHNGPLTVGQTLWVAVLAAGTGAVLAGLTAAHEAGLRLGQRGPIHVLIPAGRPYADLHRRLPWTCRRSSSTAASCRAASCSAPGRCAPHCPAR